MRLNRQSPAKNPWSFSLPGCADALIFEVTPAISSYQSAMASAVIRAPQGGTNHLKFLGFNGLIELERACALRSQARR
jgi:hypothetical protein